MDWIRAGVPRLRPVRLFRKTGGRGIRQVDHHHRLVPGCVWDLHDEPVHRVLADLPCPGAMYGDWAGHRVYAPVVSHQLVLCDEAVFSAGHISHGNRLGKRRLSCGDSVLDTTNWFSVGRQSCCLCRAVHIGTRSLDPETAAEAEDGRASHRVGCVQGGPLPAVYARRLPVLLGALLWFLLREYRCPHLTHCYTPILTNPRSTRTPATSSTSPPPTRSNYSSSPTA